MPLDIALVCIGFALAVSIYRVARGPGWGDRIVALDFLGVNVALLVVVLAVRTGFGGFLDAALIISILGFLTTVALSRYLLTGRVIE